MGFGSSGTKSECKIQVFKPRLEYGRSWRFASPALGSAQTAAPASLGRNVCELSCSFQSYGEAGFAKSETIPENLNSFWIRTLNSREQKGLSQTG